MHLFRAKLSTLFFCLLLPIAKGRVSAPTEWKPSLNFSSPAPHLFATIPSLLQQFPNTVFPNGHTLAPCSIPPYTLFYHGRRDADLPPSPEWLAFDIEMSYGITGGSRSSFMLTYQTTRQVQCLYFDGESAALMGLGQLDTQMLHLFGNVTGPPKGRDRWRGLADEYLRAQGLCDWLEEAQLRGRGWGVEGLVRMNAGFEIIWCDFASPSLRLISRMNVTAPEMPQSATPTSSSTSVSSHAPGGLEIGSNLNHQIPLGYSIPPLPEQPTTTSKASDPTDPPRPPNWERDRSLEPFRQSQGWGWFLAATYHYGSTRSGPGLGEDRARIQPCGVISWYSPRLDGRNASIARALEERERLNLTADGQWQAPAGANATMAFQELGRRRRYHHLESASSTEANFLKQRSELLLRNLQNGRKNCSGADWVLMAREIVQRTARFLKILETQTELHSPGLEDSIGAWLQGIRETVHEFLMAYLEYPSKFRPEDWLDGSLLFNETTSRCCYRYTRLLGHHLPSCHFDRVQNRNVLGCKRLRVSQDGLLDRSSWSNPSRITNLE